MVTKIQTTNYFSSTIGHQGATVWSSQDSSNLQLRQIQTFSSPGLPAAWGHSSWTPRRSVYVPAPADGPPETMETTALIRKLDSFIMLIPNDYVTWSASRSLYTSHPPLFHLFLNVQKFIKHSTTDKTTAFMVFQSYVHVHVYQAFYCIFC